MKIKQILGIKTLVALMLVFTGVKAVAQLPADFPPIAVTTNYAPGVANGYVFLADAYTPTNYGFYVMMLNNDGTPFWYKQLTNAAFDFKMLPNGYLQYAQQYQVLSFGGGAYVTHQILDENFNTVESIRAGNGYNAECHDFQMLPNGHVLLTGYYMTRVDMSKIVTNGNPAALVTGAVLQELDAQRNVVFQWRSWDHYPFTSQWVNSTAAVISEFHVNCISEDTDGNLLISTPNWVKKISRQTGQIMWHLGGTENQFTFVGVTQQQGTNAFAGHNINRLPNGHVLIYNNSTFGVGATSTAQEYALDETNMIATHIWTYTPSPAVAGPSQGSAQRLPNGNTFIGWGGTSGTGLPACTEVSGTNVVFQLAFTNSRVTSYRATRSPFPSASQANSSSVIDLATGDSYTFGSTGVSIDVLGGGGGYNRVTVTNAPYAPVYPLFQGKAPRVLPVRVQLSETAIDNMNANVNFDAASLGVTDPTNTTVYYRSTSGQGIFSAEATSYNPVTGTLSVSMNLAAQNGDFGEFIFGYPDLPDVALPPLLAQVQSYLGVQPSDVIVPPLASNVTYSVNQQRPILLSWSPAGIAAYYQFQISANQDFSNPLLDVPYQTDAFFAWSNALANTTNYYRVRTWNDAGSSDWATGSFKTVAPYLKVSSPNGGELWRRGLKYFVQWQGNIGENVIIDLYKSNVYLATIATNTPSTGAYQWQVGLSLVPGNDYTIRVTSVTNSSLFAVSGAPFSIDVPTFNTSSLVSLPDGRFTFAFTAFGSSQVSVLASTDLLSWQNLGSVTLTNGSASFMDNAASNYPGRFYRLSLP